MLRITGTHLKAMKQSITAIERKYIFISYPNTKIRKQTSLFSSSVHISLKHYRHRYHHHHLLHHYYPHHVILSVPTKKIHYTRQQMNHFYKYINKHSFSSTASSKALSRKKTSEHQKESSFSDALNLLYTISNVSIRVITGICIANLIDEYFFNIIACDGPSMMPTIKPKNEIIFVERITHRLFGLDGGSTCEERTQKAKEKKIRWEQEQQKLQQQIQIQKSKSLEAKDSSDHRIFIPTWHPQQQQQQQQQHQSLLEKIIQKLSSGVHVGDIVVVSHPSKDGTVCKRIIGLPGDIIVNSQQEYGDSCHGRDQLYVVPNGHIWIEGDNTPNSTDSRSYGSVPAALIVGKAIFRIWPIRGNAWLNRGDRPMPSNKQLFTGSVVIPAGFDGESMECNTKFIK